MLVTYRLIYTGILQFSSYFAQAVQQRRENFYIRIEGFAWDGKEMIVN